MAKQYISIGSKNYTVVTNDAGVVTSIWVQWETIMPQEVWMARPSKTHRSMSISTTGRVAKQVLAALAAKKVVA
jgi:hypothetical protein